MYSAIVSILNTCATSFGMRMGMGTSSSGTVLPDLASWGVASARGPISKDEIRSRPARISPIGHEKVGWVDHWKGVRRP